MIGTRLATLDDELEIVRLLELATGEVAEARGGALLAHARRAHVATERTRDAVEGVGQVGIIGTIDDVPVGIALAHTEATPLGLIGVVDELFVESEARDVGVGEALLIAAMDWCRALDFSGIEICVLPGDRNMKNLCERLGLSARQLTMYRPLHRE